MIPKIIHQTWKDANVTHWIFKRSQESIATHLPEWKYTFWTDEDLDALVRTDFNDLYEAWRNLNQPIKRVDAARYCILYKFGGVYADLDFIFTRNIDPIIDDGHDLYFYKSTQSLVKGWQFLGNAFMISNPGQTFWLDVLQYMLGLPPDTYVLHHTGPRALGAYYESLASKPNAKVFGPEYFDNEKCQDGVGERSFGYHVRTATWQRP